MNTFLPTAFLMAQAGMIAGLTAVFALPAMTLGVMQAMALPTVPPNR